MTASALAPPASEVIMSRAFAPPNHLTFAIPSVRALVARYVGDGVGSVDPFAGMYSPAELTNDLAPEASRARYHLDALEFVETVCTGTYRGVLFDPPYSYRQVSEHYKAAGRKATAKDTSYNFYARVMDPLAARIQPGGYAISCGWNSCGFGIKRGFELVEVLMVAHGLHHNDTIVAVERKVGWGDDGADPSLLPALPPRGSRPAAGRAAPVGEPDAAGRGARHAVRGTEVRRSG